MLILFFREDPYFFETKQDQVISYKC